jgi:hypothetical protein
MKTGEVLEKKAIWGIGVGERRSASASAPIICQVSYYVSTFVKCSIEPGIRPGEY